MELAEVKAIVLEPVSREGIIIALPTGARHYQKLAAARLKATRLMRGFSLDQMAHGLSELLSMTITPRILETWESGAEPFTAGVLGAALDVAGITEAEIIGLDNPDIGTINRLEIAIARVRALLNDPAALTARAHDLLTGAAHPLHPVFEF